MDVSIKCVVAVVTSAIICLNLSVAFVPRNNIESDIADNSIIDTNLSKHREKLLPVWFAPRMGKNIENDDLIRFPMIDSQNEFPGWAVLPFNRNKDKRPNNGKNFTPRLGRMLEDDEEGEDDDNLTTDEFIELERGRPFSYSRRLGRGGHNVYSPRLGRDEAESYI